MPVLVVIGKDKKEGSQIPTRVIAQFRRFIDRLPEKDAAFLKFSPKEDINIARLALIEAATRSKKYIKIRKARGQTRTLQLQRCTKTEFDKSNRSPKTTLKKANSKKPAPSTRRKSGSKTSQPETPTPA